jgi:hypothetical protein
MAIFAPVIIFRTLDSTLILDNEVYLFHVHDRLEKPHRKVDSCCEHILNYFPGSILLVTKVAAVWVSKFMHSL